MNSMKRITYGLRRASSASAGTSCSVKPLIATQLTLIGRSSGYRSASSRPASTLSSASRRVSSAKRVWLSESSETLMRLRPASTSGPASRSRRTPFVVSERSSTPGITASIRTRSGRSRRIRGSPPVSRTSETPIAASRRTSRAVSSNVSTSSRGSHCSPSAGMQYVQRKLHLSVTEMRTLSICRPQLSTSGSTRPGYPRSRALGRCALGPDLGELDDGGRGEAHVLDADPLALAVGLLAAREEVRRRQALLGQRRAVGAAADRRLARLESEAPDRLFRGGDDLRPLQQLVAHVAVRDRRLDL